MLRIDRDKLKIGSLNARGITYDLKEKQIGTDFDSYKLDLLAVQETHLKGNGILSINNINCSKEFKLHYSGIPIDSKEKNFHGVGIITKRDFDGVFTPVSERICFCKFELHKVNYVVISAYAPTPS